MEDTLRALHIPQCNNDGKGYEVVTIIANQVSETNRMTVIKKDGDDKVYITGGFLIEDNPDNRKVLDMIEPDRQWKFLWNFRKEVYVKQKYYEEVN